MARLKFLSDPFKGRTFELTENHHDCGRVEPRSIIIDHETISSFHCAFLKEKDSYVLSDNHSTNGSKVNGERVEKQKLVNGDLVKLGHVEMIYQDENPMTRTEAKHVHKIHVSATATQTLQMPINTPIAPRRNNTMTFIMLVLCIVVIILIFTLAYFLINLSSKG